MGTRPLLHDDGARAGSGRAPAIAPLFREGIRALRLHQWSKNALVLAAPVLGHRLEAAVMGRALLAVISFSLVASAVYVSNDLLDREEDRRHPRKRRRPFASGALPATVGVVLAVALLGAAALLAWPLPASFAALLAGYLAASLAYGLLLRRLVVIDVLLLAGLYTARIWAGSLATGVPVSEWLASFSMFLFLSLAFLKRASELVSVGVAASGRGYREPDREQVFTLGTASGYISVLVLALYFSSRDVARLYAHPVRLWLLCPLLLYWVSRLWIQARRGEVHDDPVVHALRDPASYAVGTLSALVVWIAT